MRYLLRINSRDYRNFLRFVVFIRLLKIRQALMTLRAFRFDLENWFGSLPPETVAPRRAACGSHSPVYALKFDSILADRRSTSSQSSNCERPYNFYFDNIALELPILIKFLQFSRTLNSFKILKRVFNGFKFTSFNKRFDQVEQFTKESRS